jgi:mannitol-1-phosphate/altronate dehydrogenase
MADDAGPLTLLNCDNVRHNGERFHDGMVEFLQLTGKQAVIDWMAANTTCPNTMVDRITPRPAADLPARIKAQTGIDDKAPVMGRPLSSGWWRTTSVMPARTWKRSAWRWSSRSSRMKRRKSAF